MKYLLLFILIGCSFDARINEKTIGFNLELDRSIDKEYNIVCYQSKNSYQNLSCVKIKE